MIFYRGELVDWKNSDDEIANSVKRAIKEFKSEHFGEDKKNFIQLRYPNGVRKKNRSGLYEPKKAFLLDLVSFDGAWRWSRTMPRNGRFTDSKGGHLQISDPYLFDENQVELAWFLKEYCPSVKSGKVYFEDFDKVAEQEARERVSDIDIKYAIYGKGSPIANNLTLLREVADIFGVEDVKKLGKWELKNHLFDVISVGEKNNSKYVNFQKFEELTDNSSKLRAAREVRKAINEGTLKFRVADKSWYVYGGDEWIEKILTIKPTEMPNKEGILLDKVMNDSQFKGKVYAELGVVGYDTRSEVKELGRPAVYKMCNEEGIEVDKSDKLDDLVKKYCDHKGIDKP